MLSTTTAQSNTLSATVRGAHWLIELQFTGGTQYLTTYPDNITVDTQVWTGLGQLIDAQSVSESEDSNAEEIVLKLSATNTAQLAATLGNVESYRGRRVRVYLVLFDENLALISGKVLRWSGYMQPVRVTRERDDDRGVIGVIELPCTRAGMDRARNAEGRRVTHQQQQLLYPGDRGLEMLQTLLEQPALWLSKRFQEV